MTIELTPTGLEIDSLQDTRDEIKGNVRAAVSPGLNLSSTSALGQYIDSTASNLRQIDEAILALHAGWDIATAQGAELDRLARLVGSVRRAATFSTASMHLQLDAGTYAAGTLVVSKIGDPTVRFSNDADVVSPGGLVLDQPFTSETAGEVYAPAGTLSIVANPVAGFLNASNSFDAIPGEDLETDAEFRRRISQELSRKGSTTVDGIRADLLDVKATTGQPMFSFVSVVENDTDATDSDGRPPHSIEVLVVSGASDDDIAQAILDAKPAGIRAYGLESATAYDSMSNAHTIGWSEASGIDLYLWVYVAAVPGQFAGAQAVKDAIIDYAESNQGVGVDFVHAQYLRTVLGVAGTVDATIKVRDTNVESGSQQANWPITARQIARLDPTRVTVNVINVSGPP